MALKTIKSGFIKFATNAAEAERKGDFANAVLSWGLAEKAAEKESNRWWAEERQAFCTKALAHGWGQQYAGV